VIHGAAFAPSALKATPMSDLHPAVRLGAAVLALLTCLSASPVGLAVMAVCLMAALLWTGMGPVHQLAALKPWAPVALLVIVVHTFTSTWAAPLGHPSVLGALAGGKAMLRVACSVGCLGLFLRVTPLDDLVVGVSWWLRPVRALGLRTEDLGLVVAVAMGTAPVMLGEGRRIEAVVIMRQSIPAGIHDPTGRTRGPNFFQRIVGRARVIVPLMESLARRAEALTLSLKHRRPDPLATGRVPFLQLVFLAAWGAGLVWLTVQGGVEVVR
jgi:energy-coupling factor transporter transmembrane protein EcfT